MLSLKKPILVIVSVLLMNSITYAGRPPGPLRFELISADSVYEEGAVMEFTLRITNWDEFNAHPVLLPGPKYKGKKFIYLTAHTNDGNYTELASEEFIGLADSATDLYTYQLAPEKHLDIRLKLYPGARYAVVPSEPHWFYKPLSPGTYQLKAWYTPYEDLELRGRAHHGLEDKSQYNGDTYYIPLIIKRPVQYEREKLDQCPDNCSFCKKIERGKWDQVRGALESRIRNARRPISEEVAEHASRGYWLDEHRNVIYISPFPNEMLLIFPGHWGQTIGFNTGDSVRYYHMTVQLGKIFRGRSKLQSIAYWMFRSQHLFRTTDEDYVGIKHFGSISAPDLFPTKGNE